MSEPWRQVVLDRYPDGAPVAEDFRIIETPLPEPSNGEVLCKTEYLSLDPYMRSQIAGRHLSGTIVPGDTMRGETVSRVVASRNPRLPEGALVRCPGGWRSHSLHPATQVSPLPADFPSPSLALSTLGMPGLTAWAGLHCLAKPLSGETVVISAATGGVGAVAGQLAQARACTVIGIAGSDEKCRQATQSLGYDHCLNRTTQALGDALRALCPQGIHVYFDLVGGPLLSTASGQLAIGGRVLLCGLMADYNGRERLAGPPPGLWIRARATVFGLVVYDFEARRDEFLAQALELYHAGKLRPWEEISEGLESAPRAFARLMRGENHGKVVVRMADIP